MGEGAAARAMLGAILDGAPIADIATLDTDLAFVRRALQRIANGYRADNRHRLSRTEIELLAREACDVIGWHYDRAAAEAARNDSA